MAGKPKPMNVVKQVLKMHHQGKGNKTIARALTISKHTVKSYMGKIKDPYPLTALPALEDPQPEATLLAGSPAYRDERYILLKRKLDFYIRRLKKTSVNRKVLLLLFLGGSVLINQGHYSGVAFFQGYVTGGIIPLIL